MNLLLKLILAHLIGDFLIQPSHWVKDKFEKKYKSKYLYYHIGVHALALLFILPWKLENVGMFITILTSHALIDMAKLQLDPKFNSRLLFIIDQILHFGVLLMVVKFQDGFTLSFDYFSSDAFYALMIALIGVTFVSGVLLKVFMTRWMVYDYQEDQSLESAGWYIGMLERLFVFAFIIWGHWEAIGFLLAAKSVFRFGDLSNAKDRKLTEYILIGTLISFGLAIMIGQAYMIFTASMQSLLVS